MARNCFLDRDQYWKEISSRVPPAKKVVAAVAYLGIGGSDYLPLRAGDELVVDLSLGAVKQGVTDPREIEKLIKRGVEVYTRSTLHAKVVVIDDVVIASSANVSQNARQYLDEAAILSTSPATVQAARRFIRSLCSEPVLEGYLKECLALYEPPIFKAARTIRQPKQRKQRAKLWFIGGLVYIDGEKDRAQIEPLEKEAERELLDPEHSEVSWIRMGHGPRWFSEIQRNNWLIDCTRSGKRTHDIGSPARVIRKRRYTTKAGKTYHMLMLERPVDRENLSLSAFKRRWQRVAPNGNRPPKRSQPITDAVLADSVLRFWTIRGRVSKRGER
jgi:PLD-like domain